MLFRPSMKMSSAQTWKSLPVWWFTEKAMSEKLS
jgi:hypothetical protein